MGLRGSCSSTLTDAEIETAYNNQVPIVSQADAESGISTIVKRWTPQRVKQAIDEIIFKRFNVGSTTTVNNSTVLVDAIGFEYSVPANEKGFLDMFVICSSDFVTAHIDFSVFGSGFSVLRWQTVGSQTQWKASGARQNVGGIGTNNKFSSVLRVYYENGASAGTIKLQFAQFTADPSDTVIYSESFMERRLTI